MSRQRLGRGSDAAGAAGATIAHDGIDEQGIQAFDTGTHSIDWHRPANEKKLYFLPDETGTWFRANVVF